MLVDGNVVVVAEGSVVVVVVVVVVGVVVVFVEEDGVVVDRRGSEGGRVGDLWSWRDLPILGCATSASRLGVIHLFREAFIGT